MKKEDYKPRLIDNDLKLFLSAFGAVCIEGPKWCGKTWTSLIHSTTSIMLADSSGGQKNSDLVILNKNLALNGDVPRLIDEWQEYPPLWDAVRSRIDSEGKKGMYILTGSATPARQGIIHSGAGRIGMLKMYPMSLYESSDSSGKASIQAIFDKTQDDVLTGEVDLENLIRLTIRGGWPGSLSLSDKVAALIPNSYISAIVNEDIDKIDSKIRDKHKVTLLLRSLARNECTVASLATLAKDIATANRETIDADTITEYLNIFERLFLIENQKPFSANIRSSDRVRKAEKRHFIDPSLAAALLKATPAKLMHDLNTFGFLFESLCERDLKIYAKSLGGNLYHYQDYAGREIDAVVELEDGRWGAFEIKLGAHQIETAATNLLRVSAYITQDGGMPPDVLCVVCGMSSAAYQRPDGVYVVPITALKP